MLKERLRLRRREDFQSVFQRGKALFEPEMGLFFLVTGRAESRIGVAFKQKVFPRSTMRHFLKRKAVAALKELEQALPPGFDIVLLFQKAPRPPEYRTIQSSIEKLLTRLKEYKH